jgi:hypothetical protein
LGNGSVKGGKALKTARNTPSPGGEGSEWLRVGKSEMVTRRLETAAIRGDSMGLALDHRARLTHEKVEVHAEMGLLNMIDVHVHIAPVRGRRRR